MHDSRVHPIAFLPTSLMHYYSGQPMQSYTGVDSFRGALLRTVTRWQPQRGAIKRNPDLKGMPVVMALAHDEAASVIRCIEGGADDYLPKPINQPDVVSRASDQA